MTLRWGLAVGNPVVWLAEAGRVASRGVDSLPATHNAATTAGTMEGQRKRSSAEYAEALRRLRQASMTDILQATLAQTALAAVPVLLYVGGPAAIARLLAPTAAWK